MKKIFGSSILVALIAGAALMFGLTACSNGSDGNAVLLAAGGTTQTGGGTTQTGGGTSVPTTTTPTETTQTETGGETQTGGGTTQPDGEQTQIPTPATYTITFNANDGSPNPATATQTFTAETPQALKSITELGFSKGGFNFAGWGTASDSTQASYTDCASYTASSDITLYALWSGYCLYSVYVPANVNGTVKASQVMATTGTEVILSNTANMGYQFVSYNVVDSYGENVDVVDGKFTMPERGVTVTAIFIAINYNINEETMENGSVTATPSTATIGTSVTLTVSPAVGYGLAALSVTDEDGASVAISETGYSRTFTMPAKNVAVTATFTVLPPAASGAYTKTGTQTINSVEFDLVAFGLWPQTIKAANVGVNESETKTMGDYTYCRGSDGQWYAKIKESGNGKYSDGTDVKRSSANSYKWFKVEPIKWRVLTADYNGTGKKLLFVENVLIGMCYDDDSNNYQRSEIRKWLNSNVNSAATSDYSGSGGFLKTAFTAEELVLIADTSVDNSERSTNIDNNAKYWNNGANQYASYTSTTDKVFLLSVQEASKNVYGFVLTSSPTSCTNLIRQPTDYAKSSGAHQESDYYGKKTAGEWWLRSPWHGDRYYACHVSYLGDPTMASSIDRRDGVAPALCVSN